MAVGIKFFKGKRGGYSCQFFINRQRYYKSLKTNERNEAENRAVEFKKQVIRKLKLGGNTLSSLIDSYLFVNKEKTTHDTDEYRLNLLLEKMGDIPLTDLTKADCRLFYFNLIREPSPRTGKMFSEASKLSYLTTYKALMNFAIEEVNFDFNPFNLYKKGKGPQPQNAGREFTPLEISLLHKTVNKISQDKNRTLLWRQMYFFFFMMYHSAARPKELYHLKWADFSIVDTSTVQFIIPAHIAKNRKARNVFIPKWVWKELGNIKKLDGYSSQIYVFDLKRRSSDVYGGRMWKKLREEARIANGRLYDLRHTYISQRFREGVNKKTVMEQAGHSHFDVTYDTYLHSSQDDRRNLVSKVKKVG